MWPSNCRPAPHAKVRWVAPEQVGKEFYYRTLSGAIMQSVILDIWCVHLLSSFQGSSLYMLCLYWPVYGPWIARMVHFCLKPCFGMLGVIGSCHWKRGQNSLHSGGSWWFVWLCLSLSGFALNLRANEGLASKLGSFTMFHWSWQPPVAPEKAKFSWSSFGFVTFFFIGLQFAQSVIGWVCRLAL